MRTAVRRMLSTCAALLLIGACGSDPSSGAGADSRPTSVVASTPAGEEYPPVDRITSPQPADVSGSFTLTPLDSDGPVVGIAVVFDGIGRVGELSDLFDDTEVRRAADVRLGELKGAPRTDSEGVPYSDDFAAYVVTGGRHECAGSTVPGNESPPNFPCSTTVFVDAVTGEVTQWLDFPVSS